MTDRNRRFTALQRPMWSPLLELAGSPPKQDGSAEERLRRLEDDLAIKDLLSKYAYCYDASEIDGLMSVFHADSVLVNPRGTYVGIEAIRSNYLHLMSTRKFSFHHISNAVARFSDDAREAGISSYFNCVIVFRSGALAGSSGTYVCRLAQADREWKMIEMRITLNTRQALTPAATGVIAPSSSLEAPAPAPPPTSSENSRDWIGPEALA